MMQEQASNVGKFQNASEQQFQYRFIRKTHNGLITERDPKRYITIENPHDYRGQMGATQNCFHGKSSKCWIINGWLNKADGNFLNNFFFQRVGNSNLFMGSYPLYEMDI